MIWSLVDVLSSSYLSWTLSNLLSVSSSSYFYLKKPKLKIWHSLDTWAPTCLKASIDCTVFFTPSVWQSMQTSSTSTLQLSWINFLAFTNSVQIKSFSWEASALICFYHWILSLKIQSEIAWNTYLNLSLWPIFSNLSNRMETVVLNFSWIF